MDTAAKTVLEVLGRGGVHRPKIFRDLRINPNVIKRMLFSGEIQRILTNGVGSVVWGYALPSVEPDPLDGDVARLSEIALHHPKGVLCLQSAMRYHGFTDEFQSVLHVAIKPGANRRTSLQGVKFVHWGRARPVLDKEGRPVFDRSGNPETRDPRFDLGVDEVSLGGIPGKITNPARTVCDIFQPRLDEFRSDRVGALAKLAENHGESALGKAVQYARKLGWGADLQDAVEGLKEGMRCSGHRSP